MSYINSKKIESVRSSAVDWSDFNGMETLSIEFSDSPNSGSAQMYGNGHNCISLTLTLRCDSKSSASGYMDLTGEDLSGIMFLCYYVDNPVKKINQDYVGEENTDAWFYSILDSYYYNRAVSYSLSKNSCVRDAGDGYFQQVYYIFWDPSASTKPMSSSIACGITIPEEGGGDTYTTCMNDEPDYSDSVTINILDEKKYSLDDTKFDSDNTADFTIQLSPVYQDKTPVDQDNYYFYIVDENFYIMNYRCDDDEILPEDYLFYIRGIPDELYMNQGHIWPLGKESTVSTRFYWYNQSPDTFSELSPPFDIVVNQKPNAICLTRLKMEPPSIIIPSTDNDMSCVCNVTYFDQYGNSGVCHFEPSNDRSDWGNTIKVYEGEAN